MININGLGELEDVVVLGDGLTLVLAVFITRFCKGITFIHVLLLIVFLFSFLDFFFQFFCIVK